MSDAPNPASALLDGRTVSRRLKLRAGTLDELVQTGKVHALDGGLYDVEEVRRAVGGTLNETTFETTVSEDAQTRAVVMAVQLADRTMTREGKMFETYHKGLNDVLEALRLENKALRDEKAELRAENKRLHDQLLEGSKVREQLLSKQHERDLLTSMVAQRTATQREGLQLLKNAWPLVKNHFRTQAGNSVAKQLFESIEPSQFEAIMAIDFLNENQKGLLQKLLGERAKSEASTGAGEALANGAAEAQQNGDLS